MFKFELVLEDGTPSDRHALELSHASPRKPRQAQRRRYTRTRRADRSIVSRRRLRALMRSRLPLATLRDGLTRIGERFEIQWLIYNPLVFRYYHQHAVASAPTVADTLEAVFPEARRFLDVGAGSGGFAAELQRRGHEVVALEHARLGRLIGRRQGVAMERFDLARPETLRRRTADVGYCFEVAEHLPPELGDTLVRFIAESAPTVVFTAAPPGQGGTGHINEQPETYWISRFERAGMEHRPDVGARVAQGFAAARSSWLAKNVHVFARPPRALDPA